MRYLDTSLAIALVTAEPHTVDAQTWLREQAAGQSAVSDWVTTEVASALSLKQRVGALGEEERTWAEDTYRRLCVEVFDVVEVRPSAFTDAAHYAARAELTLRAGDALHLAVAAEQGAQLCTRDVQQAEAGRWLGIDVFLLGAESRG